MLARMAMIAMTTSNSIRVNAKETICFVYFHRVLFFWATGVLGAKGG